MFGLGRTEPLKKTIASRDYAIKILNENKARQEERLHEESLKVVRLAAENATLKQKLNNLEKPQTSGEKMLRDFHETGVLILENNPSKLDPLSLQNEINNLKDINKQLNNKIAVLERTVEIEREKYANQFKDKTPDNFIGAHGSKNFKEIMEVSTSMAKNLMEDDKYKPRTFLDDTAFTETAKKRPTPPKLQAYYDRKKNGTHKKKK